jgi:hypothetical protein
MKKLLLALKERQENDRSKSPNVLNGAKTEKNDTDYEPRNPEEEKEYKQNYRRFSKDELIFVIKKSLFIKYLKEAKLLVWIRCNKRGKSEVIIEEKYFSSRNVIFTLLFLAAAVAICLICNKEFLIPVVVIAGIIIYFIASAEKETAELSHDNVKLSFLKYLITTPRTFSNDPSRPFRNALINIDLTNSNFLDQYKNAMKNASDLADSVKGEVSWLIPLGVLMADKDFMKSKMAKRGGKKYLDINFYIKDAKAMPVIETEHCLIFSLKHFNEEMQNNFLSIPSLDGDEKTILPDLIKILEEMR